MDYRKIKVTAVNVEIKKAVTITVDMKIISKCQTLDDVKKTIEQIIISTQAFQEADITKLKYQGRKVVFEEWENIQKLNANIDIENREIHERITPDRITELKENEIFVFGSNADGIHGGGAARYAMDHFGAIMGQGHGLQGKSYAIDSMSGIAILAKEIKAFAAFAKTYPNKIFLVTRIGCGIAGRRDTEVAPLFECCKDINNVSLPKSFWEIIGDN